MIDWKRFTWKRIVRGVTWRIKRYTYPLAFNIFKLVPLQNKVVASTMNGRKFDDNSKYLYYELHRIAPTLKLVWLKDMRYDYDVPSWVSTVSYWGFRDIYEISTAKVWFSTHRVPSYLRKRKGQIYIETWHGGIGTKQVGYSKTQFKGNAEAMKTISKLTDVFTSGSDFFAEIYRRSFFFDGLVWKCGTPRNDILVTDHQDIRNDVRTHLGIPVSTYLFLYAPTFRDWFQFEGEVDMQYYNVDYSRLLSALQRRFGGEWIILLRWHPCLRLRMEGKVTAEKVIDVTGFPDMQQLLATVDAMMTDYSSSIMDGALCRIPCFIFATDYEEYKRDRGVHFEMKELPFPFASNNDELEQNILAFNNDEYLRKWDAFTERVGLNESGHAAYDIAEKIVAHINGETIEWK